MELPPNISSAAGIFKRTACLLTSAQHTSKIGEPEGGTPQGAIAIPQRALVRCRAAAPGEEKQEQRAEGQRTNARCGIAIAPCGVPPSDRKSTRLNSSHEWISY